jgi:hypothetical protein
VGSLASGSVLASSIVLLDFLVPLTVSSPVPASAASSTGGNSWGGFALEDTSPNNLTIATGSWVVPTVTCKPGETSYSSEWLGMGGSFVSFFQQVLRGLNDSFDFETLYQAGTDSDCNKGQPDYDAWEEVYAPRKDKPAILIPNAAVQPRDSVAVSLSFNTKKSTGYWVMIDLRAGATAWSHTGTWTKTPGGFHTAECIVEDPLTPKGRAALSDFGMVTFGGCRATSSAGQADVTSATLPGHWSHKTLDIKLGGTVRAVAAYNPLRVVYGAQPSLPPARLLALFDHALLPAGICVTANQPSSGAIQLTPSSATILEGSAAPQGDDDYSLTVDPPSAINFDNGKANEVIAATWCSDGGTAAWSGIWVFSYTGAGWKTDYGPLLTRTYAQPGSSPEFWVAAFENQGGQWTAVEGPDDGTCLVVATANGCDDGGPSTPFLAPPLTVASLVATAGLVLSPMDGSVTPPPGSQTGN